MYALTLILNEISKLDDILEILYEIGLGATVIDSVGMGKVLLQHKVDIPIFAGIRRLIEDDRPYNKTIVSVVRDEQKLRTAIDRINFELNNLRDGIGVMFVVPVLEYYGFKVEESENNQNKKL